MEVSEEDLLQYFNENPSRYEVPETLTVDALNFKAAAYIDAAAEPADADLELYFSTNRFRYQPNEPRTETAEGEQQATPEISLADVRDQVVADFKMDQARRMAARNAQEFTLALYQEKIALDSAAYQALVERLGATTSVVPRYSRNNPAVSTGLPVELLNSMWIHAINPNRYYSDAAQTPDGAVVLVKRALTPARMPGFDEVENLVRQDYEAIEKRRLFAEKGEELSQTINQRLASESFEEIAESLQMTTEDLGQFSGIEIPDQILQIDMWDQTMSLPKGSASVMVIGDNKGSIAYMANKEIPEVDVNSEDYIAFADQRMGALGDTMGWSRLREIKDKSVAALLGTPEVPIQ